MMLRTWVLYSCLAFLFCFATVSLGEFDSSSTSLVTNYQRFLICTIDGQLHSIDSASGALLWSVDLPTSDSLFTSSSSSTIPRSEDSNYHVDDDGGSVGFRESSDRQFPRLIPSLDGGLYAYIPPSPNDPQSTDPDKPCAPPPVRRLPLTVSDIVARAPFIGPDGSLYLGDRQSVVFTVDARSGRVMRMLNQKTFAYMRDNWSRDGELVFRIARNDYVVKAVDALSSNELWNVTLVEFVDMDKSIFSWNSVNSRSPATAGLSLQVTPTDELKLMDPRSGKPFWTVSLPSAVVGAYVLMPDMKLEKINVQFVGGDDDDMGSGSCPSNHVHVQEFNNQVYVFPFSDKRGEVNNDDIQPGGKFLPDGRSPQDYPFGPYPSDHHGNMSLEDLRIQSLSQTLTLILGVASGCIVTVLFWTVMRALNKPKGSDPNVSSVPVNVSDGVLRVGKLLVYTKRILGRGSVGTIVYEGQLDDGRPVAVKRMLREYCGMAEREVSNLLSCDEHPNLVRYYSKEQDSTFVYLSLTLCAYSLSDWVEKRKRKAVAAGAFEITPKLLRLMSEIASGVSHLHSLNIVHRDIKPQNILIDQQGHARISDMGLAKQFDGTHFSYSIGNAGSTGWMAPEIVMLRNHDNDGEDDEQKPEAANKAITPAMDIFALGCLFHYMAVGTHPFGEKLERDSNILAGRADFSGLWGQPALLNMVQHMTAQDPSRRLSAEEVVRHPFFWPTKRKLQFILDASDRLEVERPNAPIVVEYENYMSKLPELRQWHKKLDPMLLSDLTHHRKYNFDNARDLLRVLRNKSNHYYDLDPEVRNTLGSHPEGFFAYFDSRFPSLFICTYEFIRHTCSHEPALRSYFFDFKQDC